MRLYRLNKTVLRFSNKPFDLLNGITSNTLEAPFNAFLDRSGKIIATCEQLKIDDNTHLILVEKSAEQALTGHLGKYLPLSPTDMETLSLNCYFDLDGDTTAEEDDFVFTQPAGVIIATKKTLEATVDEETFTTFRIQHQLPMQGIDYESEMLLNVNEERFVNYKKGCYLGQEVIARVHYKSKPPRLLVVRDEDECNAEEASGMTSKAINPETNKTSGFVFIKNSAN